MKRLRSTSKLTIEREVLRRLSSGTLSAVVGGGQSAGCPIGKTKDVTDCAPTKVTCGADRCPVAPPPGGGVDTEVLTDIETRIACKPWG